MMFPTLQHEGFNKNPNSIHSHHSVWKTNEKPIAEPPLDIHFLG